MAQQDRQIKSIGPIHLTWGKHRIKNDRGMLVKEYYIKKEKKHLIWVEWIEPLKDQGMVMKRLSA